MENSFYVILECSYIKIYKTPSKSPTSRPFSMYHQSSCLKESAKERESWGVISNLQSGQSG